MDSLYQEAMYMAEIYDIPKIIVDDYFEAFIQFVREELNNRVKTGMTNQIINPEALLIVLKGEANIAYD